MAITKTPRCSYEWDAAEILDPEMRVAFVAQLAVEAARSGSRDTKHINTALSCVRAIEEIYKGREQERLVREMESIADRMERAQLVGSREDLEVQASPETGSDVH